MRCTIKTFVVDVTPLNNEFGLLGSPEYRGIETPIFLRGLILSVDSQQYLMASVEYCVLAGSYYAEYKEMLAEATNIAMDHITLHVSHQHDVPFFDDLYHKVLHQLGKPTHEYWSRYLEKIGLDLRQSIQQSEPKTIQYVSFQNAEVHEYASDRRIYQDGKLYWRSTKCQKPELKALPLGIIDPAMYQCAFYDSNQKPVAVMNFFASHPQVADGRGLLSSDAVGVALKKAKEAFPESFFIYFDGCGADIGNGKFAGVSKEQDIEIFGDKLFQAIKTNLELATPEPLEKVSWLNHEFEIPIKLPEESLEDLLIQFHEGDILQNPQRLFIVRKIGLLKRNQKTYPFQMTKLKLNQNQILFFPGEMFLEYQKYCLKNLSGKTCVAAYGDGFIGYVPEDSDFALGGYEVTTAFCVVEPGCEALIKKQLNHLFSL